MHPATLTRRGCKLTLSSRPTSYSDRYKLSCLVRYDEYYNGECAITSEDATVRDVTWAELASIKEFHREDPTSFNAHMKVAALCT